MFTPAIADSRFVIRVFAAMLVTAPLASAEERSPDFEREVAPILVKRCLECHGQRQSEGGLVLATHQRALVGGDSGPAIVAGKPQDSLLVARLEAGEMPPAKKGQPQMLPAAEIAVLKSWIAAGAAWPSGRTLDLFERTTDLRGGRDWWSLAPILRPPLPTLPAGWKAANRVDAFVLEKLAAAGMKMAPAADRRALVRRLYHDVTGLPPSADELARELADDAPDAYERLVDRLLASPRFGERYGRHWLDVVRFAETCGYERDQEKPQAWRYRDWVVKSLNEDKPFDQFVVEQLAADELPDRSEDTLVATGFLRLGTWNDEPNDPQEYKYERLEDLVHATSSAFLGLTVKCARCHDHKFDPIWQTDYYRMASAFWAGPIEPRERELLGGPKKEELGYDLLGWTDLSRTPPPLHLLKKGDPRHPAEAIVPASLSFIPALERPFEPPPAEVKTSHRRQQLAQWIVDPQNPLAARVIVNRLWLWHFGQGLVRSANDFGYSGDKPTHPELLDWLAAELMASGQWRVANADNESSLTTHHSPLTTHDSPAWQLKRIHRLLLSSATYRQSSLHPQQTDYDQRDAANRLWWRAERRRLDAESLRDAMLAVGGQLDLRMGGPSFRPTLRAEALEGLSRKSAAWQPSPPREQLRRSLYVYSQRSLLVPLMTTFDAPDTTLPCGQRDVTTVAPQALALLNNDFVHERSASLAREASALPATDRRQQVDWLWRRVFGRAPSESEQSAALIHLEDQERHFAAHPQLAAEVFPLTLPVTGDITLHLRADTGVVTDEQGRVHRWSDQSPASHRVAQGDIDSRPLLVASAVHGHPAIRFDGQRQFLHVAGQVITSQQFTILAVVSDRANDGHRGIFSNWNGAAGNSVASVFLGLTGKNGVRLSDDFSASGSWPRDRHLLLTAISGQQDATIYANDVELGRKGKALAPRNLTTAYVIGQQGNINGEYWHGDLAELIGYNRALGDEELRDVQRYLIGRYQLVAPPVPPTATELALASLCHVLLNTNEFIYVD